MPRDDCCMFGFSVNNEYFHHSSDTFFLLKPCLLFTETIDKLNLFSFNFLLGNH
jgi:hypothetical protein